MSDNPVERRSPSALDAQKCNEHGQRIALTEGFKGWLGAIPEPILTLFGTVMLGYVVGRSYEKTKGIK
jgi:hypothetical protein